MTATNDARPYSDEEIARLRSEWSDGGRTLKNDDPLTRESDRVRDTRWLATLDAATTSLASARALLRDARERLYRYHTAAQLHADYHTYSAAEIEDRSEATWKSDPLFKELDAFFRAHDARGLAGEAKTLEPSSIPVAESARPAAFGSDTSRQSRKAHEPADRRVPGVDDGSATHEAKGEAKCSTDSPNAADAPQNASDDDGSREVRRGEGAARLRADGEPVKAGQREVCGAASEGGSAGRSRAVDVAASPSVRGAVDGDGLAAPAGAELNRGNPATVPVERGPLGGGAEGSGGATSGHRVDRRPAVATDGARDDSAASPAHSPSKPAFKVGDRVKVVKADAVKHPGLAQWIGSVGTIRKVNGADYGVEFPAIGDSYYPFHADELEPVEPSKPAGERPRRVRVTKADSVSFTEGHVYDVVDWSHEGNPCVVDNSGRVNVLVQSRWEPVVKPAPSRAEVEMLPTPAREVVSNVCPDDYGRRHAARCVNGPETERVIEGAWGDGYCAGQREREARVAGLERALRDAECRVDYLARDEDDPNVGNTVELLARIRALLGPQTNHDPRSCLVCGHVDTRAVWDEATGVYACGSCRNAGQAARAALVSSIRNATRGWK
jgi:hypothetical protein